MRTHHWPHAAHAAVVCWLFWDRLAEAKVPYLRDIASHYYPDYVFVEASLRQGVWPLWNPTSDAGAPFLLAYPVELIALGVLGSMATLALGGPAHVLLAMCGMSVLARRLGLAPLSAWVAGSVYGLSGYMLSTLNLLQLAQAAAWAPWVLAAVSRCVDAPTPRAAALLGFFGALQVTTLAAETVVQTGVAALVLVGAAPKRRAIAALLGAAALTLCLSAPAWLGVLGLLAGTRRAAGFAAGEALAFSAPPQVLIEALVPHWLGDPHTFGDVGYRGQPYYPAGFPYLLSLYVGPSVLLAALWAGPKSRWLWALATLGILLSLGSYGPFSGVQAAVFSRFRTPVKFFFLTHLALGLLAARGVDRSAASRRPSLWWLGLPCLFAAGGIALLGSASARNWLVLLDPRTSPLVSLHWPRAWLTVGLLSGALVLAFRVRGGRGLGACALVLDLLIVNGGIERSTSRDFYVLNPPLRAIVDQFRGLGPYRWFSYGAANSRGVRWNPQLARLNSDVSLYRAERQSLAGRSKVIDGLDTALDEDRTGWAPAGASLSAAEIAPAHYRQHHARLRRAGVRWVLSFSPLPLDLVSPRAQARLPELLDPLTLYELHEPLPRAFWVNACVVEPDPGRRLARLEDPEFDPTRVVVLHAPPPAGVVCDGQPHNGGTAGHAGIERLGPHSVRVTSDGAPGFVVVLEGHHRAWRATNGAMLLGANDRFWALPTPGGPRIVEVSFRPPWLVPSCVLSALGVLLALACLVLPHSGVGGRGRQADPSLTNPQASR